MTVNLVTVTGKPIAGVSDSVEVKTPHGTFRGIVEGTTSSSDDFVFNDGELVPIIDAEDREDHMDVYPAGDYLIVRIVK